MYKGERKERAKGTEGNKESEGEVIEGLRGRHGDVNYKYKRRKCTKETRARTDWGYVRERE